MLRAQSCTILAENPTAIGDAQLQQFQTSSKILEYLLQSSSIMIVDDDSVEEIAMDSKKFAEKVREQKMKIMQFDLDLKKWCVNQVFYYD